MELSFYLTRSAALKRALFPGDEGSSLKKKNKSWGDEGGGEGEAKESGGEHLMKKPGMLVGIFELNPKTRPISI